MFVCLCVDMWAANHSVTESAVNFYEINQYIFRPKSLGNKCVNYTKGKLLLFFDHWPVSYILETYFNLVGASIILFNFTMIFLGSFFRISANVRYYPGAFLELIFVWISVLISIGITTCIAPPDFWTLSENSSSYFMRLEGIFHVIISFFSITSGSRTIGFQRWILNHRCLYLFEVFIMGN